MKNSTKTIANLILVIFAFWFFRFYLEDDSKKDTQPPSPPTSLVVEDTDVEINDTKERTSVSTSKDKRIPWGGIILVIGLIGFCWWIGGIENAFYMIVCIVCFIGCFYEVSWEEGSFPEFHDQFPEWNLLEKIGIGFVVGVAFIIGWIFYIAGSVRDFFKD